MAERVYIETTVVSYLTARPNCDMLIAAHQQITHELRATRRADYALCVSHLVFQEASGADPQAAQERLEAMQAMTLVETSPSALALAKDLVQAGALPEKAGDDALH